MMPTKITMNIQAVLEAVEADHRQTSRGEIMELVQVYDEWGETPIELLLWIA